MRKVFLSIALAAVIFLGVTIGFLYSRNPLLSVSRSPITYSVESVIEGLRLSMGNEALLDQESVALYESMIMFGNSAVRNVVLRFADGDTPLSSQLSSDSSTLTFTMPIAVDQLSPNREERSRELSRVALHYIYGYIMNTAEFDPATRIIIPAYERDGLNGLYEQDLVRRGVSFIKVSQL